MIISIETSTSNLSLTLLNEENIINHISVSFENELSEIIIPTIKNFLRKNSISFKDISYLAVGCGPGSFTGIRCIIATALGIKISNIHVNTVGVNSLAGLAMLALDEAKKLKLKYIICSIDSKRDDLFMQLFKINYSKNKSIPFTVVKDIDTIKVNDLNNYFVISNIILKDILFIGHKSKIAKQIVRNLTVSRNSKQEPDSQGVGKLASCLIRNKVKINKTNFAFDKFKPIYVRPALFNLK